MKHNNLVAVAFITASFGLGALVACGKGGEAADAKDPSTAGVTPSVGATTDPVTAGKGGTPGTTTDTTGAMGGGSDRAAVGEPAPGPRGPAPTATNNPGPGPTNTGYPPDPVKR